MNDHSTVAGRLSLISKMRSAGPALAAFAALAPRMASTEVVLNGVEGPVADNVLALLRLDDEPCDAPSRRIEQLYRAAPEQIEAAAQGLGYYATRVGSNLEQGEACWRAVFDIELGEPVRIRELNVTLTGEARDDPQYAVAVAGSSLEVGAPLNHGSYERLKTRLLDLAAERGYANARFSASRVDVYPAERIADITLHFDSGPRYTFGAIDVRQDVLREELVRRYIGFRTGDPYDNRELAALYITLINSGYFETVDVRPLAADHEAQRIPVLVELTPAPRRLIKYGLGYSTDTGPRVRFGRDNRRANDRGHRFGFDIELSPVLSEITANYRLPYGDPRYQWISFDAGLQSENTDTSESDSLELGVRRVYEQPNDWTRTRFVTLLVEDFEVADQAGRSRLLMPGTQWSRTRSDDTIRPSQGSKLDLEIRGGLDELGSDTTFAQVIAAGKWIWSVPSGARILVRSKAGVTYEEAFEDLPASVRFFAGGDNSVRGYDYETLGPVDEDGEVIGGSSLLTASFEYEHPLRGRWSLAFFVDSGNAFNSTDFDAKTGAGFGVRWQSPVGPVRLDLAYPLDDRDQGVRFHLSVGPDL